MNAAAAVRAQRAALRGGRQREAVPRFNLLGLLQKFCWGGSSQFRSSVLLSFNFLPLAPRSLPPCSAPPSPPPSRRPGWGGPGTSVRAVRPEKTPIISRIYHSRSFVKSHFSEVVVAHRSDVEPVSLVVSSPESQQRALHLNIRVHLNELE